MVTCIQVEAITNSAESASIGHQDRKYQPSRASVSLVRFGLLVSCINIIRGPP